METTMMTQTRVNEAIVTGVGGNIVSIKAPAGVIVKNEVANILVGQDKLKSDDPGRTVPRSGQARPGLAL